MRDENMCFVKNWKCLRKSINIVFLFISMMYYCGCIDKNSPLTPTIVAYDSAMTPQYEIQVQPTPEYIIEPTPIEMPPEVDLGWHDRWELFEDSFKKSAEEIEEIVKGRYEDRPIYLISSKQNGLFTDIMINPYDEESLKTFDLINRLNSYYQFNLDNKGEKLLREFILSRTNDGKNARLYLYIDNGCIYERDGSLSIVKEDGTIAVYKQHEIPWDEIPKEYWDDIAQGYTLVDMSGDDVVLSCNVNDIGSPSSPSVEE